MKKAFKKPGIVDPVAVIVLSAIALAYFTFNIGIGGLAGFAIGRAIKPSSPSIVALELKETNKQENSKRKSKNNKMGDYYYE